MTKNWVSGTGLIKVPVSSKTGKFEVGFCDCFKHCDAIVQVLFCAPCNEAKTWAMARGDECQVCHSSWLCPCCFHSTLWTRSNIRHARGMNLGLCADCCAITFCTLCVECQNRAELDMMCQEAEEVQP